ncbi:MAG TPA: hypothetical protein V6C57_23685 [Coleofasciculaceae cyanobacterium]
MFDKAVRAAMMGQIDAEQLEVINTAAAHGDIFKGEAFPVVDADGDRLIKDQVYLYRGEKVRVTNCVFGSGNIMDCWYWVYFIDSNLEDSRITVEAKFPEGLFGPKSYTAPFTKASKGGDRNDH